MFDRHARGRNARCLLRFVLIGATLGAWGCQGEVNIPDPPTGRMVSFANDIQPIFSAQCAGCHRANSPTGITGVRMVLTEGDAYDSIVNQPSAQDASWTLVTPGDSDSSLLYLKVSSNSPPVGATMPLLGSRLSSSDLALIRDWIEDGALDN